MPVQKLFVYHVATGRILATADYDDTGDSGPAGPRAAAFGNVDPATIYAPNGVITARPANPAAINKAVVTADDQDAAVISNLANPSKVTVRSVLDVTAPFVADVVDGTLSITFNRAGSYEISVESFPAQDARFQVQAVTP